MKIMGLIAVIVAFLVGIFFGWSINPAKGNTSLTGITSRGGMGQNINTNSQDLLTLNNLLREHGDLAVLHLEAIYDSKDLSATQNLIDTDNGQIVNFLDQRLNIQNKNDLAQMWQQHIDQYAAYTRALKNRDQAGMQTAKNNLEKLAIQMGQSFNKINSKYNAGTIESLMNEHVILTLAIINAHASDNYGEKVKNIKAALDQATSFSEYLVSNI